MEVSQRLKSIPPYVFAEIDKKRQAAIAAGVDVINLGIGDPDQPTPRHIVEAMHDALENPANHHYPPFGGTKEFKEAIATWCKKRFGFDLDPVNEITSLIGSKEGLHNTIMAFIDKGDINLIPDPAYPVYRTSTILAGGEPYYMPLTPENNFIPDLEAIPEAVLKKAKLLMFNYPNNPTAGIADLAFFEKAVAFAKKHNILLCHDLAYSEMTFDGYKAPSIMQVKGAKDICIELHSLSKTYNMTGWRIGFAVGNAEAIKAIAKIKSNIDTDIFKPIQLAAIAGLTGPTDHIDYCNKLYIERRDLAVERLTQLGWPVKPIKATFYMWLPVPPGMTSADFATLMLDKAGIVVPPGTAYGPHGEGFIRMSLCLDKARMAEAFDRMAKHSITYDMAKAKV
ncbi:MAG: LL-diaminopimelate aminotransferase [Candidatus Obscuribacter sp.]|jgi:LL-diaminopimelate aminotransferase|nr:LL-diaminopimelate aminotransferase [Candidatus Obscuribacter sp.]MBL0184169.1 LL-diaminopimelate aminotransferase [Candidatus Obscuribacter sp.]MBP6350353.1 LL-diaminopimelate aminotransferase [Candidatus Obscuribacter sp.]MBP6592966.1 LL-diaminopimelate aminotransferase [Candidatus Obscuribacter sp.]MBP7576372.1 LL-diaminopimelate aminotransferase [Candidatus Obscuribacter sp.]